MNCRLVLSVQELFTHRSRGGLPLRFGVSHLVLLLGLLLSSLACPVSPEAATLTVTDLGDSGGAGQLRTLITAAAPGDTITVPAGTITLTAGSLQVSKNLSIQGAGLTIIDGKGKDRVLFVFGSPVAPSVAISGVTIQNGKAGADGGGGILNFGHLTLSHAIVTNNNAKGGGTRTDLGGGLYNGAGGTMIVNNVAVTGNSATGGGGIYNPIGASLTLTDVTVSNNDTQADMGGAGIYNAGTLTLTRVTVSGNTTGWFGGGILNGGAATLTNVTVSGNTALNSAGMFLCIGNNALFCPFTQVSALTTLTNVTIAGNTAGVPGGIGGILTFPGTPPTLSNVIVSGNTTANCSGAITSLGHNLDSGATCGFTGTGDLSNTDPLLGPLQDNGGFTSTRALLAGSPAIDAGANAGCPPTDQRGVLRPQGAACDIGAHEFSSSPPGPVLDVLVNGAAFTSGSVFKLDLLFRNTGVAMNEDFYLGVLLPSSVGGCPHNDPVAFFVGSVSNEIVTCLSGPSSNIVPFARNIAIPAAVPPATIADFLDFVWSSGLPAGSYTFFAALADAGTSSIRALGLTTVSFTP